MARVEPRWEDGVFFRGTHKARTLRRREATERVDAAFLDAEARLWGDGPKNAKDVRVALPDVSPPAVTAEAEAIGKARLTSQSMG